MINRFRFKLNQLSENIEGEFLVNEEKYYIDYYQYKLYKAGKARDRSLSVAIKEMLRRLNQNDDKD